MGSSNFSKIALLSITSLSIFAAASVSEARDRVDRRQGRQSGRVEQGIRSDEITAAEAHRLQKSKRAIRRVERRAEKDGQVTQGEAAVLEQMQDARSKQIHRVKHNDKTRSEAPETAPETAPEQQ